MRLEKEGKGVGGKGIRRSDNDATSEEYRPVRYEVSKTALLP